MAIAQFNISTTGAQGLVSLPGLGKIPGYAHPITVNLLDEFSLAEIENPNSGVQDAINAGFIVATNENNALIANISSDIYPTIIKDNLEATANPTNNDDLNVGYSIGSRWINLANSTVWTCTDNANGSANWLDISVGSSTPRNPFILPYTQETSSGQISPFLTTTQKAGQGWRVVTGFPFSGTNTITPTSIVIRSRWGGGTGEYSLRIIDIDNGGLVIASITGLTSIAFTNNDLGVLSNLPTTPTNLEFQTQVTTSNQNRDIEILWLQVNF
jgi:hypothetical protein